MTTRLALLGPANSIHLQRWANALARRGHRVCVISQHPCEPGLLDPAVEVEWLRHGGERGYFLNAPSLRRLLAKWRPGLLNIHYASGYGTTAALSGFAPTLLSVWGSDVFDFPYESRLKALLLRWNLRRATAIASTSHAMARQVQRLTPERKSVAVTPFGVDMQRFAPLPGSRTKGRLTIGTVKSLEPAYGVDLLLRACAGLLATGGARELQDWRLLIVGGGSRRTELEALAFDLGIGQRTEFVGALPHDDVPAGLNRFDIYAAPSRSESFGVAVIEASACELPVIVSDAGGLPEVVRDGETGLVVPRDNVPALQAALERLLLDPALRERLGRNGRAHVEREFEWNHCVDLMEKVYTSLIRGRACATDPA